jgi:pyrroloquinoline quinone (PQQ) biosynthesis protein C
MDKDRFLEALLHVMERKEHWAWPLFTSGKVPKNKLHIHFEQEYATYVRDFPVMVGWAYVQCPVASARRELIENVYEEETGGLVAGQPHPELFLQYPRGLGMDLTRFENITLLPASQHYRTVLNQNTQTRGWASAAAVTTLFVEGTAYERGEVDKHAPKRPVQPLEKHPLVVHYGLRVEHLALTKAHRQVEGEHRTSAWHVVLEHVPSSERHTVVLAMEEVLKAWLSYRDGVAEACGLVAQKV